MNELRKIDLIAWLYNNMTTEELIQLVQIANDIKNRKNYEKENHSNTGKSVQTPGR